MANDKPSRTAAPNAKDYHTRHPGGKDSKEIAPDGTSQTSLRQKLEGFLGWYKTHKKISLPATVGLCLVLFFAIPVTRYSALGLFVKQDFPVVVVDSQTGKPVSSAQVVLRGVSAKTDAEGKASLNVPVGSAELSVTKAHYKATSQAVVVPVGKPASSLSVELEATGRPIPVTVLNSITGQPVAGASLSSGDSTAETDDKGQAILVVPVGTTEIKGKVTADGYNTAEVTIKSTTDEDKANTFTITPSGKIYFLSNQSGKIDVVKANLDGTGRETVLAGTGKEDKTNTVLLATREWRYLALLSKRDGGEYSKLFLIDTSDGTLKNIDEGEATFSLIGWEGNRFLYRVDRQNVKYWQTERQAIKSFDAETKKLSTLDETTAEGTGENDYIYEQYTYSNIFDGKLIFIKDWQYNGYSARQKMNGKSTTVTSVSPDGKDEKTVKSFPLSADIYRYVNVLLGGYEKLYIRHYEYQNGSTNNTYFVYQDGKVESLSNFSEDEFNNLTVTTYLQSPSQKQSFWYENRDGKRAFFVGDPDADLPQVMTLDTDYQAYGWLTDDYVLLSKKGSELYIAPASGVTSSDELFKITDYYKPDYNYYGYGGGYGGL